MDQSKVTVTSFSMPQKGVETNELAEKHELKWRELGQMYMIKRSLIESRRDMAGTEVLGCFSICTSVPYGCNEYGYGSMRQYGMCFSMCRTAKRQSSTYLTKGKQYMWWSPDHWSLHVCQALQYLGEAFWLGIKSSVTWKIKHCAIPSGSRTATVYGIQVCRTHGNA